MIQGRRPLRSADRPQNESFSPRTQQRVSPEIEETMVDNSISDQTFVIENCTANKTTDSEEYSEECNQVHETFSEKRNETPKQQFRPECYDSTQSRKSHEKMHKNGNGGGAGMLFVIVIVLTAAFFLFIAVKATNFMGKAPQKNCSYNELQNTFPSEEKTMWRDLSIGLEHILNHDVDKPGVYLFMHKDKKYVRNFVRKVAEKSSSCFGNRMSPVEITEEAFSSNTDYGHIIESFRNNLKRSKVIVIANLNEIPAEAALALHPICDTHSPIEKDVIIFLTLVPSSSYGNPSSIAKETLRTLWGSELKQNQLDALITRVTDAVIQLQA